MQPFSVNVVSEKQLQINEYITQAREALANNRCPNCAGSVNRVFGTRGFVQCENFGKAGLEPRCNYQGYVN